MALNFGGGGMFKPTGDDGFVDIYAGGKMIPAGISSGTSSQTRTLFGKVNDDNSNSGFNNWTIPDGNALKYADGTNGNSNDWPNAARAAQNSGTGSAVTEVRVVRLGSITGNNNAAGSVTSNNYSVGTYGGAADKWGTTWTRDIVNGNDFGVAISYTGLGGGTLSRYLNTVGANSGDFRFNIPSGATIVGIEAAVTHKYTSGQDIVVDMIKVTVFYSGAVFEG